MSEEEIQDLLKRTTEELLSQPDVYLCRICDVEMTASSFSEYTKRYNPPSEDGEQECDGCIDD